MKNFDVYLRKAIRKEPVDWSEHYVDYEMLKGRLSAYAKRRKSLLSLLKGNVHLTYEDLQLAMSDDGTSGDYFQYVDADEQQGVCRVPFCLSRAQTLAIIIILTRCSHTLYSHTIRIITTRRQ